MTVWVEESLRRGMEVQRADGTVMLFSTLFGQLLGYQVDENVRKNVPTQGSSSKIDYTFPPGFLTWML